ncbi:MULTISPECIES: Bug family tripartite tricarboxylate transporter substrate binding protein [Achromobacter]|uniref:Tripartite tricarboxylate transporter substrate binding protein n=1 Tax=Achromobacter spanius TaxID=217203 RepID=A0ABY8GN87_9BURK|nr:MULTISPECIES: tripartite tricarboxylate transporter substrate binding protein [Achromobacter]WAI84688.1 tripartite tricarboxylate transporter substrate binding protein [Achromobacter spanius]WEX94773.1 tripartite tricarboxylate transporter substrate binding protein [Achromobacter sp. SS2-2022]WFP06063.1 tripartite tricarboxylate transporter substrate binding protein [Achromobacter spanius]
MKTITRRLAAIAAALSGTLAVNGASLAAAPYPDRPVTIVVGYAAGGATDIVARLMAKSLTEELGQSFVVENKTGANSNIGAEIVSRATADGYTLYMGSIANTINRSLYSKLNYDFVKDFKPVGLVATIPNILVVNPKVPIKTVQEYIAYAKANPGKLTCASSGSGSSIHLSCELFKMETSTDILHVPYRGSGPAVADLLGGQVDSMFDNLPSSLPHVQAGKLRALGVTSPKRLDATPDVPTLAESGLAGFDVESWFGLMAPAGTPDAVVKRLNEALNKALASAAVQASYKQSGFYAPQPPNTPQTFSKKIASEIDKWGAVVKRANIKAN